MVIILHCLGNNDKKKSIQFSLNIFDPWLVESKDMETADTKVTLFKFQNPVTARSNQDTGQWLDLPRLVST
jgi:hypothetical protein